MVVDVRIYVGRLRRSWPGFSWFRARCVAGDMLDIVERVLCLCINLWR